MVSQVRFNWFDFEGLYSTNICIYCICLKQHPEILIIRNYIDKWHWVLLSTKWQWSNTVNTNYAAVQHHTRSLCQSLAHMWSLIKGSYWRDYRKNSTLSLRLLAVTLSHRICQGLNRLHHHWPFTVSINITPLLLNPNTPHPPLPPPPPVTFCSHSHLFIPPTASPLMTARDVSQP